VTHVSYTFFHAGPDTSFSLNIFLAFMGMTAWSVVYIACCMM